MPEQVAMAINSLNTLTLRKLSLNTTFAADQLHLIAKKDSLVLFMAVYIDIFGSDIPPESYKKLYQDAQANTQILHPTVLVTSTIPAGGKATFNSETQVISVGEKVVLSAVRNNDSRGELMTILVEEYGHYLDYLLRNHYAKTDNPDAEGDEGAKFAYKMYMLNPIEQHDQHFADVTVDGQSTKLIWDFSDIHNDLKRHVNEERQKKEDTQGNLEFFKAGNLNPHGEFGHKDITEEALTDLVHASSIFFENIQKITNTIYLGNWMRDFSQAVDPMIIRPLAYVAGRAVTKTAPTNGYTEDSVVKGTVPVLTIPEGTIDKLYPSKYITNLTVAFRPVLPSVEMMTTVVELAATKEFIHQKKTSKRRAVNYQDYLDKLRTEFVEINPENLGVYRPEEHIDNPKGLGQNEFGTNRGDKTLYNKFTGFVPNDHALHDINKTFGLKNYIRSSSCFQVEGAPYLSAYDYIQKKLKEAAIPGGLNTPKALVDFGAAMHTLEDYFAHTNYVEVSLIKSVQPMVFPWVDEVKAPTGFVYKYNELRNGKGYSDQYILVDSLNPVATNNALASYIPIVTGTFGLVDTAASVLPILNEHVFNIEIKPWEKAKAGERSFADILIREMLKDIDNVQGDAHKNTGTNDNSYAKSFDALLSTRDWFVQAKNWVLPDAIQEGFHWLGQHIARLLKFTQYFLIKNIAAVLNDAQVALDKDLDAMEAGTFSIGIDPSHTQIAKDDPHHPVHELAAKLAIQAVKEIGVEMIKVWGGTGTLEKNVLPILDKIVRHPVASTWQDDIVLEWARANPAKVCAASTPSVVLDRLFHLVEEVDGTLKQIQQSLSNEDITEQIVGFFTDKEGANKEFQALKSTIQGALRKGQTQLKRIEGIKKIWDEKYPKPANCQSH